ncbi:MAG: bacillithiol biosynthesis cysteine-adding enzyme BshC [Balneolaceae bacterium]
MNCSSSPFKGLPFSSLFQDYLSNAHLLRPFFNEHPFDSEAVEQRAEKFSFIGDRTASVQILKKMNRSFGGGKQALNQVEKLKDPRALTVVTGQQLMLFGGPLFTIYKTLTAIIYARRWENELGRPVIPVFWLADEDHDFPEVAQAGILNRNNWHSLTMKPEEGNPPVGRIVLDRNFEEFESQFFETLQEDLFTELLRKQLGRHYRQGKPFREAFAGLMLELFEEHGLIIAGSDDREVKKLSAEPMIVAASRYEEVLECLEGQSQSLEEEGYHRQATVQQSNLFYLAEGDERIKIDLEGEMWRAGDEKSWKVAELAEDVRRHPENFSPNVFIRPLLQDRLLPVFACVAGPGEIGYYAQMKPLYNLMGQEMPFILPRFSVTLIEPAINRIMEKLPFDPQHYIMRIEDLEHEYIEEVNRLDIDLFFEEWKVEVRTLTSKRLTDIANVDPTLEAAADKAGTQFENELDSLRKKLFRAQKREEETQLKRLARIRDHLFPESIPQERQVAFVSILNRYGVEIFGQLLELLEGDTPDMHKWVRL